MNMKRFYQNEWQGIRFSDFTKVSSNELPSSSFYNLFYKFFFNKYSKYEELDSRYKSEKRITAEWIINHLKPGDKVLSVGCGIGFIEYIIFKKLGQDIDLHISDFANVSLKWIEKELPLENIHLNGIDDLLREHKFDFIYFSALDYALETDSLVSLLCEYKQLLSISGTILMISASYLEEDQTLYNKSLIAFKDCLKFMLKLIKVKKYAENQFWGWMRTKSDYRELFSNSGFNNVEDGFICPDFKKLYFIKSFNN
jgi:hypothetical protein